LSDDLVLACLLDRPADRLWQTAFEHGLSVLDASERRGALGGTTGHIAESVAELLLDELGYHVIWHFKGPSAGGHGIDLLEFNPDTEHLVAVEVKGTLQPKQWPRMSRGDIEQFTAAWLSKQDNPGMIEWGLADADVLGIVVLINFAEHAWKAAVTDDFKSFAPVGTAEDLRDLAWLGDV
jgi:hypothetical protein